jgi:hypothetical protein
MFFFRMFLSPIDFQLNILRYSGRSISKKFFNDPPPHDFPLTQCLFLISSTDLFLVGLLPLSHVLFAGISSKAENIRMVFCFILII